MSVWQRIFSIKSIYITSPFSFHQILLTHIHPPFTLIQVFVINVTPADSLLYAGGATVHSEFVS